MTNVQALPPKSLNPIRKRRALLVGINKYDDANFPQLNFCVSDVKALEEMLKQRDYEVLCLHDLQTDKNLLPKRDNIEEALIRLCRTANRDDLLFVHFACHGKLVEQKPVLICQDTKYLLINKRALSLAEIEKYLHESEASRLILSLDACHTGVAMGRDVTELEFIRNVYDLAQGYALFAASTAEQAALEWQEMKHGVYTYYLLKGLQGEAILKDKNIVTVSSLQAYLTNSLKDWSFQNRLLQEATFRTEGIGDMILADYREGYIPISVQLPVSKGNNGTGMGMSRNLKSETISKFELLDTLERITPAQFAKLVFLLQVPKSLMPAEDKEPTLRAIALLEWAEAPGGCGLQKIKQALDELLK